MNRAAPYFQLAALLAGGAIGVLAVGAVAAALGSEALAMLFVYGGGLLALSVFGLVIGGFIMRRRQ